MARLSITLADSIFAELQATRPAHRPLSQHIADLVVEAMGARKGGLAQEISKQVIEAITEMNKVNGIS